MADLEIIKVNEVGIGDKNKLQKCMDFIYD
jgi:hypothetical protein